MKTPMQRWLIGTRKCPSKNSILMSRFANKVHFYKVVRFGSHCEFHTSKQNNLEDYTTDEFTLAMKKNIQANPTDPLNYLMLGIYYYEEVHGIKDIDAAKVLFEKAAELGSPEAMNYYAIIHEYAQGSTKEDFETAVMWYMKAAELGFAAAISNLGFCYSQGRGVPQDHEMAFQFYRQAALKDNIDGQFNLGNSYLEGRGVEQNFEEAMKWYKKCAETNHAPAMNNIGILYEYGLGVEKNLQTALEWMQKASFLAHGYEENIIRVREKMKHE